jgi:hypothetical protein
MPPTPSPTYERLRETIAKRMRMSHVVQPLMLMELLGRGRPGNSQSSPRAGRCPADPGRRRVFCALEASGRVLLENELALCIADADPVSEGLPCKDVSPCS